MDDLGGTWVITRNILAAMRSVVSFRRRNERLVGLGGTVRALATWVGKGDEDRPEPGTIGADPVNCAVCASRGAAPCQGAAIAQPVGGVWGDGIGTLSRAGKAAISVFDSGRVQAVRFTLGRTGWPDPIAGACVCRHTPATEGSASRIRGGCRLRP